MTDREPPPEDVSPPDPRLASLLEEARRDVGSDEDVRALRASLGPLLWPGGGGPPGSDAGASSAASHAGTATSVGAGAVAKVGLGAAIVLGAAGLWLSTRSGPVTASSAVPSAVTASPPSPSAPPMQSSVPEVLQPSPSETTTRMVDGGRDEPAPSASGNRGPDPATSRGVAPSESALLGQAQAALGRNPALALSLCEQHRAWFPRGMLVQEREVIAIEALSRSGRRAEAGTRADRFLKAFPRSAYRSKVLSLVPR